MCAPGHNNTASVHVVVFWSTDNHTAIARTCAGVCAASAGSSTQIGVLVVPFCVVLAWMMGQPLDLNFKEFEALVLFISVLLAAVVVQVGGTLSVGRLHCRVDAAPAYLHACRGVYICARIHPA